MIKFVSDLRQVSCFFLGILVSSTNKTSCHDITEILMKVVLNTITLTLFIIYTSNYIYFLEWSFLDCIRIVNYC